MFEAKRELFFPVELVPGITVRPVQPSELWAVFGELETEIFAPFGTLGAFEMPDARWESLKPLREVYSSTHHEWFVFTDTTEGKDIGWAYGSMRDSMTFFMTNTGILPVYRRRGIYGAFLGCLLAYLEALGYERVVSNHQTNNRAVLIAKLKAGFNITAVNLDERWGAQVELTYLIHDDRWRGYECAFSLQSWDLPPKDQSGRSSILIGEIQ